MACLLDQLAVLAVLDDRQQLLTICRFLSQIKIDRLRLTVYVGQHGLTTLQASREQQPRKTEFSAVNRTRFRAFVLWKEIKI